MTARFFRLIVCQLMLLFACATAQAADGIEIVSHEINLTEDGYRLSAKYAFDLNPGLEQAIQKGVEFSFTTEIDLTRPRWWFWTDEHTVSSRRTVRLKYDVLTRVYYVSTHGSLRQPFDTLDLAMASIRRPTSWLIAPKGALSPGQTYNVTLRMGMDRDLMLKPLQIDALNNADLRLTSPKKTWTYRAE